ncbi:MAG: tyrosine-type recombinase/integrase [Gaiellaceae bacterium]
MNDSTVSPGPAGLVSEAVLPLGVQEALGELVGAAKEGLLALSVDVGLAVLAELIEEEVDELVGPKGRHDPERAAVRHGHEAGEVTLGGRRLGVERPRVRSLDGRSELPLATYAHFADRDPLTKAVLERMLDGISTRRYQRVQEPVGARVEQSARSTSRSAVSRSFVASCHRRSTAGRRDFAILTLLLRLGLRRGELARLQLGDVDWRAGEIVIRGKGDRQERLPLPTDVGKAVAGYLRRGRPASAEGRWVFVRVKAPHRPLSPAGVTQVVVSASRRAGLGEIAAHRLRHTAATEMLRAGATLPELGQVLRHCSLLTTAI